eukprot:186175_1
MEAMDACEESEESECLIIPYALRGRDFDENFRAFTHPYFDMHESVPYYSSKDSKLETIFCNCMIYTKCQCITVHYPITLKLLHKMIIDGKSSLYLKCRLGNIGRTSAAMFINLMHKDIVLVTHIAINVHIDRNTIKPTSNCRKLLDYKNKCANKNDTGIIESCKEFRNITDALSNHINKYNNSHSCDEFIYFRQFELRPIDRDWNKHCNQAVYARRIEDALYEYHKSFRDGLYFISYFAHLFKHEMLIGFDGKSKCSLYILIHNNLNNDMRQQEIIGCIKQNDTVCLEYRVIITPTHKLNNIMLAKL